MCCAKGVEQYRWTMTVTVSQKTVSRQGIKTRVVNLKREDCDVYGGRPGRLGNQFLARVHGRDDAIARYEEWLMHPDRLALRNWIRENLPGKRIGCFCAPARCHLDIVARIANGEIREDSV